MSEATDWKREAALIGLALKKLREDVPLTQGEAGERMRPQLTSQAWGLYENGKVKGIREASIQDQLVTAIGQSRESLEFEVARIAKFGALPARTPATSRATLAERHARQYVPAPGQGQERFLVKEGEVILNYPETVSPETALAVEQRLLMFIQAYKARAGL